MIAWRVRLEVYAGRILWLIELWRGVITLREASVTAKGSNLYRCQLSLERLGVVIREWVGRRLFVNAMRRYW